MPELITILTGLSIGFFASIIGVLAGAGGLVSIPLLIFAGLPPQVAIATNKCISLGLGAGAIYKFYKAKKILWKYVPAFLLVSLFATYTGTKLLLSIDEALLSNLVGILLLAALPLLFMKKEFGVETQEVSIWKKRLGYVFYFFALVYASAFGAGAGSLVFLVLIYFFGFNIIDANATDLIPWYVLAILSLIIFAYNGIVNFSFGIPLAIGGVLGGYTGAHLAVLKGNRWVKRIFVLFVIVMSIKLLFFS